MLETPVALIIFNRPETTTRVLAAIAEVKPKCLFVIADGPRPNNAEDIDRCAAARSVIDGVDWPCEVVSEYAESNLGCKTRVSSGLDWLFEQTEEAIVLEDDCLPHPSFFEFCSELLKRYREDSRVMHIGGSNFQLGDRQRQQSYYFSRHPHIWGWATWQRAWRHYDVTMADWPAFRDGGWLDDALADRAAVAYWQANFQSIYDSATTWDVQWLFACLAQNALSVTPSFNLVANIGAGPMATHSKKSNWTLTRPVQPMPFPLSHPQFLIADRRADKFTQKTIFRSSWSDRLQGKLWRHYRQWLGSGNDTPPLSQV